VKAATLLSQVVSATEKDVMGANAYILIYSKTSPPLPPPRAAPGQHRQPPAARGAAVAVPTPSVKRHAAVACNKPPLAVGSRATSCE